MVRLQVVAVYLEGQPKALREQTRVLVRQTNNRGPGAFGFIIIFSLS